MTDFGRFGTFRSYFDRIQRRIFKRKLVHETRSAISGNICVYDRGRERILTINGEEHSVFYSRGGWKGAEREYWGVMALPPFTLPANPEILMLGLGGGTLLRLIEERIGPRSVTVVELDPAVVSIAREYFGLDDRRNVKVVVADALPAMTGLKERGITFDVLFDDVYFGLTTLHGEPGERIYGVMRALTRPGGTIVFNRPVDNVDQIAPHGRFVAELRSAGNEVVVRSIRRRWWNDIIYCRIPGR